MRYATYLLSVLGETGSAEQRQRGLNDMLGEVGQLQYSSGKRVNDLLVNILAKVHELISGGALSVSDGRALADFFLAISAACTKLCVGTVPLGYEASTKPSAVLDTWVLATAPARLDLAGGWSDTPPICFDGSVGKWIFRQSGLNDIVTDFRFVASDGDGCARRRLHPTGLSMSSQ